MFVKIEPQINTGIHVHRNCRYAWETALLKGAVRIFEEQPDMLFVDAWPHLPHLREMDVAPDRKEPKSCKPSFDEARGIGIFLGTYPSFDIVDGYVHDLERIYSSVLENKGAENRVLRMDGNIHRLHPTNQQTSCSFGTALRLARNVEIFTALRQGASISLDQMIGRIFRSLANTLGTEYFVQEELNPATGRRASAIFTYNGIGSFEFEDQGPDRPVKLKRYSHSRGNYLPTFEGDATYPNLQRHVFNWLIDAMRDMTPENLPYGDDYAMLQKNIEEAEMLFRNGLHIEQGSAPTSTGNILRLVR